MKYYLIEEIVEYGSRISKPLYVVEKEEIAKDLVKRFDYLTYTEYDTEEDDEEETCGNGIIVPEEILERLRHAGESAIKEKENNKMNKDLKPGTFDGDLDDYITSTSNTVIGYNEKIANDTIIFNANHFILKDKTLDIEIDLKARIADFNKIVIDGVTFTKEKK